MISIAENYIRFLVSKNRLYLPPHLNPKDSAIDLTAELFTMENSNLVKFRDFFRNNLSQQNPGSEEDYEKYLRCFIYTIIQNNLHDIYKDYDRFTYNIIRNIKEAVKSLNYVIILRFSDKYIQKSEHTITENPPDREYLLGMIYSEGLSAYVMNLKKFLEKLFVSLGKSSDYSPAVRFFDVISVVKSLIAAEFAGRDGADNESSHIADRVNIRFLLDDARFSFSEKLRNYISRQNLSENFAECMYNIIDEVIKDFNAGNERQSVLNLMKRHFKDDNKNLFYKVQYCVEIFESEVAKNIEEERLIVD